MADLSAIQGDRFLAQAYFMRGGMEAIYDDMNPVGFMVCGDTRTRIAVLGQGPSGTTSPRRLPPV